MDKVNILILAALTTLWLPSEVKGEGEDLRRQPYGVKMCEELSLKKGCSHMFDKDNLLCSLISCQASSDTVRTTSGCKDPRNDCKRNRETERDMDLCGTNGQSGAQPTARGLFIHTKPGGILQFFFRNQTVTSRPINAHRRRFTAMTYSQLKKRVYIASIRPTFIASYPLDHYESVIAEDERVHTISMSLDDVNGVAFIVATRYNTPLIRTVRMKGYEKIYSYKLFKGIKFPSKISLDTKHRRLYISKYKEILSCTYGGKDMTTIASAKRFFFKRLFYDVITDFLYYNDGNYLYTRSLLNNSVLSIRKLDGVPKVIFVHDNWTYILIRYRIEAYCSTGNVSSLRKDMKGFLKNDDFEFVIIT